MAIDISDLENNTDNELIEISEGINQYGAPTRTNAKIILHKHQEEKAEKNLRIQRKIKNMTTWILIFTFITLVLSGIGLYKLFKPSLPTPNIQPHQKYNQPNYPKNGEEYPLHGVKPIKPIEHK